MRLASHNEYSWSAFWLLGADFRSVGWPFCGEVEITEMWVTKVSWDNAVGKAMVPRTSPFPVAVIALPPRLLRACSALAPCVIPHDFTARRCLASLRTPPTLRRRSADGTAGTSCGGWPSTREATTNSSGMGRLTRRVTTSTASRRSLTRSGGGPRDTRTHTHSHA